MTIAHLRFAPLLLAWALLPSRLFAETLTAEAAAQVDKAVTAEMASQELVGTAVGIVRDGEIVYLKGYGFADREAKTRVSSQTLFRWASISKPLCAIAALQLEEQGKLDLDGDVRSLVPEFPDKGVKITPRQLLCHQGGIVHYTNGRVVVTKRDYDVPHPFESVVLALDTFKESPLLSPPGEKFSYSTHGYVLLSAVVERAAKEKFADQIRNRIVRPLGMKTLQPDYQWVEIPGRAVGYRKRDGEIVRSVDSDVSWKLGGGGYLSNIDDLTRFGLALVKRELVNKETEERMWTPQPTLDGKHAGYGLGFRVDRDSGRLKVSHGGAQEKTRTHLAVYPREGHGVAVMCNCEHAQPERIVNVVKLALGF